jgi:hypothetical protein
MNRPPIERLAPDPEAQSGEGPLVVRIGFVLAGGVVSAIVSSFLAALRMGEEASVGRALEQWVVLAAFGTPIGVAAVAVLRRARVGLRLLMGEHAPLLAIGVLWWSVIELGLLSVFGAALRKTTHHHALAGVTFAIFAVISGVLVAAFAHKATAIMARGGSRAQRASLAIAGAASFVVVLLVMFRTSRAEGLHTAGALVDAFVFAVSATLASSRMFTRLRPLALAGGPLAVFVMLLGFLLLRGDTKLRGELLESAPVHALVMDLFGG